MKYKSILKTFCSLLLSTLIYVNNNIIGQAPGAGAPGADAGMPFTLSPEDIEALKAGSSESPMGPITDKDIEEFVSFINNLSEEDMKALEGLAEEAAKEIEAAAKQEAAATTPTIETKPQEPLIKKEEKPKIPSNKVDEAKQILSTTVKYINDLKQEASKEESVSRRLNNWSKDLNDIVYYLNVFINNNVLLGHLLSTEFANFYENLKKLNRALEDNIKSFSVEDIIGGQEYEEEDPYEILGVEQNVTQEELEAAYEKIKTTKDPKKLEAKLKAEKINEKEIKRKVKEARLSFNLIESAYESLKNPKSRAQIDKEIKSKESSGLSKKEISKRAFAKILDSFGTAFYDNKILQDCQAILKKYDPVALETKKELDKAEAAAKKAKEDAAKKTVSKSSGGFRDDFGFGRSSDYPRSGGSSYDYPSGYGSDGGGYGDWGTQGGLKDREVGGGVGGAGAPKGADAKGKTTSEKQPKEEKPKGMPSQADKAASATPVKVDDPIKLMQEIDANLSQITNNLENNPRIVRMLSTTHEVPLASGETEEKTKKRNVPLSALRETGIVKWASNPKSLSENQGEINYLDSWQKSMQFDKLIEKAKNLEALVKSTLEKNPKIKKELVKEFNKGLAAKLTGPITDLLLTVKTVPGNIKQVNTLLKNVEPIYDSLHNIRSYIAQETDIVEDIKNLSRQLAPIAAYSQSAQDLDAQIKGQEDSEAPKATTPQTQQDLDNILQNLEGDRIFLSQILKNINRLSTQIENASSASKQTYDTEWKNSVASQIPVIEKLLKILQNNATQDVVIRKNTKIVEAISKKLNEIDKNI